MSPDLFEGAVDEQRFEPVAGGDAGDGGRSKGGADEDASPPVDSVEDNAPFLEVDVEAGETAPQSEISSLLAGSRPTVLTAGSGPRGRWSSRIPQRSR
ncbi:MAG: hypothetical protein J2O47_05515 [Acidimicrobiaceae bacterium]|nr:hypothetical protein [Acidimicrobiaceae bacterium]